MLSNPDAYKEIKEAEDVSKGATAVDRVKIKLATLVIKLLLNIRANQVLIMKKEGIELVKPKARSEEITEKQV